jgi:4-amino-4-deoxy-L-arabinose transferase-like glycosyltransferase
MAFLWRAIFVRGGIPNVDLALKGDEGNYFALATSFLETGNFVDRWPWTRPPLYPLILAGLTAAGNGNIMLVQYLQAGAGAASAAMVYLIARHSFGPREAKVAGTLSAFDPTAPLAVQYLFAEGIATLFTLSAFLMLVLALEGSRKAASFGLAGVALGLSLLSRPSGTPFVLLVSVWLLFRRQVPFRERIGQATILLAAVALVISVWTVRNWQTYDRIIPLDTTLGVNLYQHNSDLNRPQVYAELMKIPNPGDREAYAVRKALAWIVSNPVDFGKRALHRLSQAWIADRYSEWDIALRAKYPAVASWVSALNASAGTLWFLALVLLGSVGLGLTHGSRYRVLFLLFASAYMATTILVESVFRYRLALSPFLAPLAATVPFTLRREWKVLPWTAAGLTYVLLSIPGLWPAWPKDLAANSLYLMGRAAEAVGRTDTSGSLYLQAMSIEGRADFFLAAATQAASLGRLQEAKELFERAHRLWPDDPRVLALITYSDRLQGIRPTPSPHGMAGLWAEEWAWDHLSLEPRALLTLGEDDLGYVRGLYGVERSGQRTFRWTGQRAWFRLWAPAERVRLVMLCASGATESKVAQVLIAGSSVSRLEVPAGKWRWVALNLPGVFRPGEMLLVEVSVPHAHRYGADPRPLGIQVSQVRLEPVQGH